MIKIVPFNFKFSGKIEPNKTLTTIKSIASISTQTTTDAKEHKTLAVQTPDELMFDLFYCSLIRIFSKTVFFCLLAFLLFLFYNGSMNFLKFFNRD